MASTRPSHRSWLAWRTRFELRRLRPFPPPPPRLDPFPGSQALARTFAHFQLGETGEGRIAHQIESVVIPGIDADYCRALQLFVAEEGRHARVLAGMVHVLGGALLTRHWTARLFTAVRHLLGGGSALGIQLKLLVLLTAEILGLAFYRLVTPVLPTPELRRTLREMCRDEASHLRFHADFFAAVASSWASRAFWRALLCGVVACATVVVLVDHAPALSLLASGRLRLAARVAQWTRLALRRMTPSAEVQPHPTLRLPDQPRSFHA